MLHKKLEQAVSLIYESVADPAEWIDAMRVMAGLMHSQKAATLHFEASTGAVSKLVGLGHEASAVEAYLAYYGALDPGRPVAARASVGVWQGDEQLLDLRASQQQEFVRDFALPNGIGRLGGAKLWQEGDRAVFLSFHREPGSPSFARLGRQTYERLLPHLMRAEKLRAVLGRSGDQALLARASLDALATAAFVVDADLRLLVANRRAERLLSDRVVETLYGRLTLFSGNAARSFETAVACAMPPSRRACALTQETGSKRRLQVLVLPLSPGHELSVLSSSPLALVLGSEFRGDHLPPAIYEQLLGLTPSEAAVAHAIAHGMTVAQCAEEQSVAVSTVRAQLSSALYKAGCASQSQLVAVLRSLPSIDESSLPHQNGARRRRRKS